MTVETIQKGAVLTGWLQMAKDGRWRALTPSGYLTCHPRRETALEALLCSISQSSPLSPSSSSSHGFMELLSDESPLTIQVIGAANDIE